MNTQQQELEKIREELQLLQSSTSNLLQQTTTALANIATNQSSEQVVKQQPSSSVSAIALTPQAIEMMIRLVLAQAQQEAITQLENESSYIDAEEVVELELCSTNQISISLDTDAITSNYVDSISIEDLEIDIDELLEEVQTHMQATAQA